MRLSATLRRAAALALLAAPLACTESTAPSYTDPTTQSYAASLGVDIPSMTRTTNGVYYHDVTVGTGTPVVAGNRISVRYQGFYSDGVSFDDNLGATDQPLVFTVGGQEAIFGFSEGVLGMRPGGERTIVIPPQLGYGINPIYDNQGNLLLRGNAVLVFKVTLLGVQ
jgi:peptidylprolyl isomerase